MNLRRLLLKVMLWSLGVGAVLGAISILLAPYETVWRVVGTCFATALAALLMLGCSILMDKPHSHESGLVGMIAVAIEYFLALVLIWELLDLIGLRRLDDEVAMTMALSAPVVPALMVLLRARGLALTRITGNVGAVLSSVQLLLLWIAIWTGRVWDFDEKWYATAGWFALFGVIALTALVGVGTGDGRWWRWIGVAGSIIAFVAAVYGTWADVRGGDTFFASLIVLAAYPAYANFVKLCPLTPGQIWLRVVTLISAAVTAACIVGAVYFQDHPSEEALARVGGAAGIIAGCGTLALLVLARLNRRIAIKPELTEIKEITIVCPICRKKQTVPLGNSTCTLCGLKLHIQVEEPRCPNCNYLLVMLQSERCPECGTPLGTGVATA